MAATIFWNIVKHLWGESISIVQHIVYTGQPMLSSVLSQRALKKCKKNMNKCTVFILTHLFKLHRNTCPVTDVTDFHCQFPTSPQL